MEEIKSVQGFIETYYPDYYHSDEIAQEGDLHKLLNDEYEQGDGADELLQDEYEGNIRHPQIEIDHTRAYMDILERSIQGYVDQLNEKL
jgi:hypothetical protein